ncbi:MAG TPA: hypothetical protein VG276_15035 [Actinomycetes bacterium]|jgi:hypothetical protein|nr:hypothetical protein [Actinomycetes bacterium]
MSVLQYLRGSVPRGRWTWLWVQTAAGLVLTPLEVFGLAAGNVALAEASLLLWGPFFILAPWTSVLVTHVQAGVLPDDLAGPVAKVLRRLSACWLGESVAAAALSGLSAGRGHSGRALLHAFMVLLAFWCTWLTWGAMARLRQRHSAR